MKTKEDIVQAYGTTWAGNGSDQLPTPMLFLHPGSNYMMSATGVLSPTMSLEVSWGRAANSLNYELQQEQLFRVERRPSPSCRCCSRTRSRATTCREFQFRGGRTGNAGQYQTDRGPVHQREHHPRRRRQPDEGLAGSHALEGGLLLPEQLQAAEHLRQLQQRRSTSRTTASNPFDTGYGYANAATGVFNTYTQASKFAIPEWRYNNIEFYAQDNWKAGSKLTLDYGVRFYYLTPQWDDDAAGVELPARASSIATTRRGSSRRSASAPRRAPAPTAAAWIRALVGAGRDADARPTPSTERFIGRLTPGLEPLQRRVPGRPGHHRPAAGRRHVQGLAARRRGLRPHRQGRDDPPRRLGHLLRPAAGQHGVRHDRQRARAC